MNDDQGDYDELEDDFLLLANEGQPALVQVESDSQSEKDTQEYGNKGVVIVKDEEEEQLKAMREKLRKQFGIG
jgi:hypothetical protein